MRQRRDEFVIRKKRDFVFWKTKKKKSQFYQHKISIGGTAIHIVIRFAKI